MSARGRSHLFSTQLLVPERPPRKCARRAPTS